MIATIVLDPRALEVLPVVLLENRGLFIDFTSDAMLDATGHYGLAIVNDTTGAELLMQAEVNKLTIDFTDPIPNADGHYGVALIKDTSEWV